MKIIFFLFYAIALLAQTPKVTQTATVTQTSAQKFEVSRKGVMNDYKDRNKLLDSFTAAPSFADGPFSGIAVSDFTKDCPLPKFGIKSADTIQMVNGQPIRGPSDIIEIGTKLTKLNVGSRVRVQIHRGEKNITNSYLILE